MALKEGFLVKTVLGTGAVQLKADPGEAFLVKDIIVRDPAGSYLTVKCEKSTVGYFRVGGTLGSHLAFRRGRAQHSHTVRVDGGDPGGTWRDARLRNGSNLNQSLGIRAESAVPVDVYDAVRALLWSGFQRGETILDFLAKAGIFKGFPVAEGETLTIEGMGGSNSITVIVYEQWDPGDIKVDQENGSRSKEYFYLNYGSTGAVINASGDTLYDTAVSPAEFPDFPFGKVVPAKHEMTLFGILASPFAPALNDGTNYSYTQYLKLLRDRAVLFDEDRNGILFLARSATADGAQDMKAEGFTLIGNFSEYDNNPPLLFPTPLVFAAGDELNVYVTTVKGGSGQDISTAAQEICLIEKVKRVE